MRYADIKKPSQDEQQNQTTTTTNNDYIQNFMPILKKLINKVKIASDKTETKQNILHFIRKNMRLFYNKAR